MTARIVVGWFFSQKPTIWIEKKGFYVIMIIIVVCDNSSTFSARNKKQWELSKSRFVWQTLMGLSGCKLKTNLPCL